MSPGFLEVVGGELGTGRFFDSGRDQRGDRVVVLGRSAAEELGMNRVSGHPAVFIDGRAFAGIGILDSVGVRDNLLNAAIVPVGVARAELDVSTVASLDIRVDIGAGSLVGRQAPMALNPSDPAIYKVKVPASSETLKGQVAADINVLFVAVGLVALVGGGIGIANVTLLSVSERRAEIGLRRALRAKTSQIAAQFIIESLVTGFLGGLIEVGVGLFVLLGVCLFQGWTPVVAWWVPLSGVSVGGHSGAYCGDLPRIQSGADRAGRRPAQRVASYMRSLMPDLIRNQLTG